MEPWLRKYNYVEDYFNTAHKIYEKVYQGFPVTYYSIDFDNSVMDLEQLNAGTYEKDLVGPLSGTRFLKILMLPVFSVEPVQPRLNADERGLTTRDSMRTQLAFPDTYNLKPNVGDVVWMSQDFMMKTVDTQPLLIVNNVEYSNWGDYVFYKCDLDIAPFSREQLELQISEYFSFHNFYKRIYRQNVSRLLVKLEEKAEESTATVNGLFEDACGFYLFEKEPLQC